MQSVLASELGVGHTPYLSYRSSLGPGPDSAIGIGIESGRGGIRFALTWTNSATRSQSESWNAQTVSRKFRL